MTSASLLGEIQTDLQRGRFVVYLEGKTDPDMFFALLGIAKPLSGIHQDVYVRGLEKASGGKAVRARVDLAKQHGLALGLTKGGVVGLIDGDGRARADLAAEFDSPHDGPLFSWKAYCLENLLAKAGWPRAWPAPSWTDVLASYSTYAALNRVHVQLRTALETLGLAKFNNPQLGAALLTETDVTTALAKDKMLIAGRDVAAMFVTELGTVRAAIAASLDDGHALINGKWLVRHYACSIAAESEERCRDIWCAEIRAAGGLPEVRAFWQRTTGQAP